MLMNRLATWPPSNTQSTVSPAKTFATFSSGGSTISVDWSNAVRTTGGERVVDTTTVRGALGTGCLAAGCACSAAKAGCIRPRATAMGISGFTGGPFFGLSEFTLGKTADTLGEPVFGDQLR